MSTESAVDKFSNQIAAKASEDIANAIRMGSRTCRSCTSFNTDKVDPTGVRVEDQFSVVHGPVERLKAAGYEVVLDMCCSGDAVSYYLTLMW